MEIMPIAHILDGVFHGQAKLLEEMRDDIKEIKVACRLPLGDHGLRMSFLSWSFGVNTGGAKPDVGLCRS